MLWLTRSKVGRSSYSAVKASLVVLARTWAEYIITVNVVAPGPI